MSKTPKEWLEKIDEERAKGNVCYMTFMGLAASPLSTFIDQPYEGILYDLNRLPEVVSTWIEGDIKWVNDYAVSDTIKYLKEQNDALASQINRLAEFIMQHIPGEPSKSEGAVDCAIRIMTEQQTKMDAWGIVITDACMQRDMADAYVDELQTKLDRAKAFHPRATKLIEKEKPFLVVACDEPYYAVVYAEIRAREKRIGRWSPEDEIRFQKAIEKLEA